MKKLTFAALAFSIVFLWTGFVTANAAMTTLPQSAMPLMKQPIYSQNSRNLNFGLSNPNTLRLNEEIVSFLLACRCTPDKSLYLQEPASQKTSNLDLAGNSVDTMYLNEEDISFLLACRCTPNQLAE